MLITGPAAGREPGALRQPGNSTTHSAAIWDPALPFVELAMAVNRDPFVFRRHQILQCLSVEPLSTPGRNPPLAGVPAHARAIHDPSRPAPSGGCG